MKRKRRKVKWKVVISILLVLVIGLGIYASGLIKSTAEKDLRPEHCDEKGCVPKQVFEELPPYPENFMVVWNRVYYAGMVENFSKIYPDENYYKQPEFYANTFEDQCNQYYTILPPDISVNISYPFVAGSGPYPGDVAIEMISQNETIKVITYWHTSCAVVKYQGLSLAVEYPTSGQIRMGTIKVENQDPEIASNCFDVEFNPEYFLLEPNYPWFRSDWTKKIEATIKVKENCPPNWYFISVYPTDPPKNIDNEWFTEYGFDYSTLRAGGIWQIFVQVV